MDSAARSGRTRDEAGGGLHLIKLCVGAESVEDLADWQAARMREREARGEDPNPYHVTRMAPKRADELLDGGSLYWVIKGATRCRQRLVAIEPVEGEDGVSRVKLVLDPEIAPVEAQPRRPFQGWRYLPAADAPRDLLRSSRAADVAPLPQELEEELAAYGVV